MNKKDSNETNFLCPICNNKTTQYGKKNICKKCYMAEFHIKNYSKNEDKIKKRVNEYYYDNKDKCLKNMKTYVDKNKDKIKEYYHNYTLKNYEKQLKRTKKYYEENKVEINKKQYQKKKIRLKEDTDFYIKELLSTNMRMTIMYHKGIKKTRTLELLGADIKIVRKHIEDQFVEGMTWENHGKWHFDHIIPCDSFDLKLVSEQKKCFYYKNIQPLWAADNIRKANKMPDEMKKKSKAIP